MAKNVIVRGGGSQDVTARVSDYLNFHDDSKTSNEEKRKSDYATMINHYYDLVTDFYEYGWGTSFHFGRRAKDEGFHASIARAEHFLAFRMRLDRGMKVLDVGCGVGGPARSIARFAEVHVTGLNNNQYQVNRANEHTRRLGMEHMCTFVKGDFMKMPFPDNHFDAVYQIEATPHAPDKTACFAEILRVLKPGGVFGSYEWCLTDKYDASNERHRAVKKGIEEGDGLPDIATTHQVNEALEAAGFTIEEKRDLCEYSLNTDIPWYDALVPRYTPSCNLQHTKVGRLVLSKVLSLLELVHLAPKGTVQVQQFLETAADALVESGEKEIFTPMYFTVGRKSL